MSTQTFASVLSGTTIAKASPQRRVKLLANSAPLTAPESPTQIAVSFVPAADPGAVTSAVQMRGAALSTQVGAKFYGLGGSTGIDVAGNNLLSRVYGFGAENWTQAAGTVTFGSQVYKPWSNTRSPLTITFETKATRIGVAFGSAGARVRLLVNRLDGAGWTTAAQLRPHLGATVAGTMYFDFAADTVPSATKRIYIEVSQFFCGLVLAPSAQTIPFDGRKSFLKIATFGDSIGPVLDRTAHLVGGALRAYHGDGGTGYAIPTGTAIGGGIATSNANLDWATVASSMSGNRGFNDGSRAECLETDRTDALIAAMPDIVIGAHGLNDSTPYDTNPPDANSWGWRISTSVATVWSRLRNGLGSSVLVCCYPWSGSLRGVDGISGGGAAVNSTIKNEFLKISGPSIFINNRDSTWIVKLADGTIINGATGIGPWITGVGTVQNPAGVGNADLFVGDGTHPASWASTTLTASATLPTGTLSVAATAGVTGNFPPAGMLSIQADGPVAYPGQVITYTGKTGTTFTGCTGGAGTFPIGSNVYLYQTTPGEDYYGDKVAAALCAALAVL